LHKKLAHHGGVMQVLNTRVMRTVKSTGIDYFHFTEKEQYGLNFGERLSNSIQEVFDKGYESVICLGNDTPLLTISLIQDAAAALKTGKAVKGKSLDGGLYLIGLHKNGFDEVSFQALPWQSSGLAVAFHKYIASQNQSLLVLEALADIDTEQDLEDFLAGKDARDAIIRLLLMALSRKRNNYKHLKESASYILFSKPLNKGSPKAA
jgi:2-phospho-L-lactate guanylyltransferase (CobY/MobA/RfbA family)